MSKWDAQLKAAIKPASNEAEAALHGEIRRHVAGLKGAQQRLAFLEQHASDPIVAASVLEAPAFLSGLTDAETTMIRGMIEAQALPPEVAQAKKAVGDAMTDCARGWHRARDLIGEDAKLTKGADGSWTQPAEVDADANAA